MPPPHFSRIIVPPAELEALLLERPDISDSGVIGIFSDAEATELPRAYIVPRDPTLLEDAKRGAAAAFVNDVDAWVKSKVAQHKFLRGGMLLSSQASVMVWLAHINVLAHNWFASKYGNMQVSY